MKLYTLDKEANPFPNQFSEIVHVKKITDIKRDGVLILWGGSDLWPGLYNERPNRYVYAYKASDRDLREIEAIHHCLKHDIKMIGICRGAQLLCVKAGGKLVQHIENHGRSHEITLTDEHNARIWCNSSHHQMMLPPIGSKILATGDKTTGKNQENNEILIAVVPEVVWFPQINALGIQPHPEWASSPILFNNYCERKIAEYIL